mgnify:CR=1 FL=1
MSNIRVISGRAAGMLTTRLERMRQLVNEGYSHKDAAYGAAAEAAEARFGAECERIRTKEESIVEFLTDDQLAATWQRLTDKGLEKFGRYQFLKPKNV